MVASCPERLSAKGHEALPVASGTDVASRYSMRPSGVRAANTRLSPEGRKQAVAKLDSMTPEERLKAQAEAQKAIAADAAARQKTMAQVKAIHDAVEKGAISGAEAGVQAFVPLKKFCPNCGAPRGNGRFCSKCGNKFN